MIRICFICLGNICRSPMAEFIMKDKVNKLGLADKFLIESKATSYEESGNDIHYGTRRILDLNNIPYSSRKSTRVEESDLDKFDYFICSFHMLKRLYLLHCIFLPPFHRLINHPSVGIFLGSLVYFTDICICFCARTIEF